MEQYIPKSALLAEIEKLDALYHTSKDLSGDLFIQGLFCFLDTLEVKEVDLDGISRHYALNNTPWDDCVDEIQEAYKAGFELGLKTEQKGE